MPVKRLREESGYSLVEVMASIVILAVAIIPMVGMFDMGLNLATEGSNYDKARALANLKLEQAKSLPFDTAKDNFPEVAPTPTAYDDGPGYYQSGWEKHEIECPVGIDPPCFDPDFANFDYMIEKQYMAQPPKDSALDPADPTEDFATSATPTNLIRVTVSVRWPDGTTYTTFGLVTR